MVSNYDRIFKEIQREAGRVGEDVGVDPALLTRVAMEIVDLEDRHRVSNIHDINKQARAQIENTIVVSRGLER